MTVLISVVLAVLFGWGAWRLTGRPGAMRAFDEDEPLTPRRRR